MGKEKHEGKQYAGNMIFGVSDLKASSRITKEHKGKKEQEQRPSWVYIIVYGLNFHVE